MFGFMVEGFDNIMIVECLFVMEIVVSKYIGNIFVKFGFVFSDSGYCCVFVVFVYFCI